MIRTDKIGQQPIDELFEDTFETAIYTGPSEQDEKPPYSVRLDCFCRESRSWKSQRMYNLGDLMKLQSLISRTIKRLADLDDCSTTHPELWIPRTYGLVEPKSRLSRAFRVGSVKTYIHEHGHPENVIHSVSFRDSEFLLEDQRIMGYSCYDLKLAATVAYKLIQYLRGDTCFDEFEEETASITVHPIELSTESESEGESCANPEDPLRPADDQSNR